MLDEIKGNDTEKQGLGHYREISNRIAFLIAVVIKNDAYVVQFFEPSASAYPLSDLKFQVLFRCFAQRAKEPQPISVRQK